MNILASNKSKHTDLPRSTPSGKTSQIANPANPSIMIPDPYLMKAYPK